jgi:hypothetical protein
MVWFKPSIVMNHSRQDWLQNLKTRCCLFKFLSRWYMMRISLRNAQKMTAALSE